MSIQFETVIIGNAERCRTEAEISAVSGVDSAPGLCALVYEDSRGFQVEWLGQAGEGARDPELVRAVERAKARLQRYVHRRGENVPEGLGRAGLSLWLMEMDDGTSMGMPVR